MPEMPIVPAQFVAPDYDANPPLPRRTPEPVARHDYADDGVDIQPVFAAPPESARGALTVCCNGCGDLHTIDCPTIARQSHDDAPERDAEAVAATPAASAPSPDAPPLEGQDPPQQPEYAPVPLAAGTYAIYADGHGGYAVVVKTSDGAVHHKHLPARLVKMAEMAMGGSSPFAGLFGP